MKTVIGIDYGTQSARAVLVNTLNGEVLCSHSVKYSHGVMAGDLAKEQDYRKALEELLLAVTPKEYKNTVAAICVDATSLTMVPVAAKMPASFWPLTLNYYLREAFAVAELAVFGG